MLRRPRFKAHYRVQAVDGEGLVLLSEAGQSVFPGRLYGLIAPWLDGQRTATEVADRLREAADPDEVRQALEKLDREGHLAEGPGSMPAEEASDWEGRGLVPGVAARRVREGLVSVESVGDVDADPFAASLRSLHVRVGEPGSLGIVLTDDYLRAGLRDRNRRALREGRPWMLVRPIGREVWIGPVFHPGRTGCWECLALRLRTNRAVEAYLQDRAGRDEPFPIPLASTPATRQVAWNLAASKVAEWLAKGGLPDLEGNLLTFDVRTWQTRSHALIWQPHCPACGDPPEDEAPVVSPVVLQSRKKAHIRDGGHRALSPESTIERFEHHVSPITGVVSRLVRHGISDQGVLHVYTSGVNSAVRRGGLDVLNKGLRSHCSGKGASDAQARASGLCEALERHSAVFRGDEPRLRSRLKDLGEAAIHPNDCMRFSDTQYERRDLWNAKGSRFNLVPAPFDPDAEVEWTPAWSLTRNEARLLPTAFCYFNYPGPVLDLGCMACSNGNAAGNTQEEAILQGFLEVVERDSVALWWYNRLSRPSVDLASFDNPYLESLAAFFRGRNRDLWALDLTADLGIPVFAAVSRLRDRHPEQLMVGFGAHLDAKIAILRAVTELNQFLAPGLQRRDGDMLAAGNDWDPEIRDWLEAATLANQPYLAPDPARPPRVASDFRQAWGEDLKDDVLACQALVERHGMEMLVLDQTRPDIGLPVVKVIVPGLRHFWARFAPGRLYDVPVRLGWLSRPLSEDALNPIPLFV